MTLFSFAGAMLVAASSSAATPLYRLYQESMHLTPFWITIVFAVYVASLLAGLLTVGGLSDYVGRRPVILAALLLNAAAMILFAEARDVGQLILARAVQGLCVGTGTTALGAAILDTNRARGPLLNSVTPFVGMTAGSLGTAALITFAPDPLHTVYEVLLGLTALMIALLWVMPETAAQSRRFGVAATACQRAAPIEVRSCQAHAGQRGVLGARRTLSLADADRGGDGDACRLALGRRRRGFGADVNGGRRGSGFQGLAGAASDFDGHQHIVAGGGGLIVRNPAAAGRSIAGRYRDRRSRIRVDLLG